MNTTISTRKKNRTLLLIGILMIAGTLRVPFTGIAPLLDMVKDSFVLTTAQIGLLTTIPLLAFYCISLRSQYCRALWY